MTKEIWKPVVGYEGSYEVSDQGRVRSMARDLPFKSKRGAWHTRRTVTKFLKQELINSGYLTVHLSRGDRVRTKTVHALVAAAFIGPRPAAFDVAHSNGQRLDNRATNLRYATRTSNHADKRAHGTHACGEMIAQAKLTAAKVRQLRRLQGRATLAAAGQKFGVAPMTVKRVWDRTSWSHVA